MKKLNLLLLFGVGLLCLSCTKSITTSNVEAIPYRETEDGQWGMISMDGKVLFKEEFKNEPTIVREGRFFVQTEDNIWEMYEASEKPKKIGKDYAHISSFYKGVAVVAEKNRPVSLIKKDGSIIKELKTIDGKEVDGVVRFFGGYANFMTTDSLWGAIDTKGNCVVKPEYIYMTSWQDGKIIGIHKRYKSQYQSGKKDKYKYTIINNKGKVLFEINANKYEEIGGIFVDGKMPISVKIDGQESWGIIDDKGNTIVKPNRKYKMITQIKGENFIYYNGEGWGLMNIKGETLIRAKYDRLYYDQENLLLAQVNSGDETYYKFIDIKDNQIGTDKYVESYLYRLLDGKHTIVKMDDKMLSIIDREGKQVEGLPDIKEIGLSEGSQYIESDYVDLDKFVKDLGITADGLLGLTFKTTTAQAVAKEIKEVGRQGTLSHKADSPYWYDRPYIGFSKQIGGVSGYITMRFSDDLSRQTYRTKRVIDYELWGYYYYHDEEIPTGYVWNNVKPVSFSLSVQNSGRMKGKVRSLFKLLIKQFSTFGKIYKQNDGAAVINLNNGKVALIILRKYEVSVQWGEIGDASSINIDRYNNIEEDYDLDDDYEPWLVETPTEAEVETPVW